MEVDLSERPPQGPCNGSRTSQTSNAILEE